jgi:hypothetical protein
MVSTVKNTSGPLVIAWLLVRMKLEKAAPRIERVPDVGSGYKLVNGGMSVSMQLRLLLRNDESVTVMMLFCGCPLARSGTWRKHFAD